MSTPSAAEMWSVPRVVEGDWAARRELADALRDLAERCVRTEAGGDALRAAAALAREATALLPEGPTAADAFRGGSYLPRVREWIDRGALMGRCNPTAPPMEIALIDGRSSCEVTLGERYVGAPGISHGGVLAACFDQICGHCAVMNDHPGLTVALDVRYLRPAHVHAPLRFEAEVTAADDRRATVEGTCASDGQILARATAVFVKLHGDRDALFRGRGPAGGPQGSEGR